MNLNFHLIDVSAATYDVRLNLEEAAYDALVSCDTCEDSLMAMAELVDWEQAVMVSLSGLGLRCERALRQRLLSLEDGRTIERMAGRSAIVNELFQELTRTAESLPSVLCLVA